jgi:hypothetical protein
MKSFEFFVTVVFIVVVLPIIVIEWLKDVVKKRDEQNLHNELSRAFSLSLTNHWQLLDEVLLRMYLKKSSRNVLIKQYAELHYGTEAAALLQIRLFIFNQMIDQEESVKWRVVALTDSWCDANRYRISALPDHVKGFYVPNDAWTTGRYKPLPGHEVNDDQREALIKDKTREELLRMFQIGHAAAMVCSRNDFGEGDHDPRYKKPSKRRWWEPIPTA